jgi:uncharacterized protein YjiS (DUF1127 family)
VITGEAGLIKLSRVAWRRRSRSRRELAMLGPIERRDLGCRLDLNGEMHKPFWQA